MGSRGWSFVSLSPYLCRVVLGQIHDCRAHRYPCRLNATLLCMRVFSGVHKALGQCARFCHAEFWAIELQGLLAVEPIGTHITGLQGLESVQNLLFEPVFWKGSFFKPSHRSQGIAPTQEHIALKHIGLEMELIKWCLSVYAHANDRSTVLRAINRVV